MLMGAVASSEFSGSATGGLGENVTSLTTAVLAGGSVGAGSGAAAAAAGSGVGAELVLDTASLASSFASSALRSGG